MKTLNWHVTIAVGLVGLAGCGGGGSDNGNPPSPRYVSQIAIQGLSPTTNYSFDLGLVSGTKYYFTDRNSSAIQVIDIPTLANSAKIQGAGMSAFAGVSAAGNSKSGPDGVNAVGSLLYAGDVNSVKIVDPATNVVVKDIVVSTAGVRADEGCVDAAHHLYMISSPEEQVPSSTFVDTNTQTVVAKVTFTDNKGAPSAGLEQCRYDAATDSFFVNDDGTIHVASNDEASATKALRIISEITAVAEIGKTYLGKVVRVVDFGAFVEIFPGTDGLLHISEIAENRIKEVRDELKEGDQVLVKVLSMEGNKIKLSRKAVLREQREKLKAKTHE